jgi:hypothetical protein
MNLHFREYTLCGGRGRCHRVKRVFLSWSRRGLSICDYWGRLGIGGDWAQLPNVVAGCKFTPRRVPVSTSGMASMGCQRGTSRHKSTVRRLTWGGLASRITKREIFGEIARNRYATRT